ncbi:exodeoxyribonuclease V subunit alpha [Amphritea japonica]|uniref:RecBCD enzyme subunit RecD n=1 Tax=Amphritea japonica ATCC BAA-1530 TaxID=1278309 RepID=A0A7R6STB2_9GAMM|nr:exodeoxyribonuclease V subunit alpha [Amphritea japonica]BBB26490.1 exodeoxyribonuclease V alpha subunit [Amphritea japonica ATCC BAA-1530]
MQLLQQLRQQQLIRPLDTQFARFIRDEELSISGQAEVNDALPLLAALVSLQLGRGEVCLPLNGWGVLMENWPSVLRKPAEQLLQGLCENTLIGFSVITDGAQEAPLVLSSGRLYLYRYWLYETDVAARIQQLAAPIPLNRDSIKAGLRRLFIDRLAGEIDWQQIAVAIAISRRFSVISGGPGTGKTTTVARLLALYAESFSQQMQRAPLIKLAAPTGKAAARLSESLAGAREGLPVSDAICAMIPNQAVTLHRLLGPRPDSKNFRHNAENPLHLDLLVVDEASMIDLPMIYRLLSALPPHAQLIMIGDRDQLASVEAGSVLGDICSWDNQAGVSVQASDSEVSTGLCYRPAQLEYLQEVCELPAPVSAPGSSSISDALALLRRSYRFDESSGIGYLARAVNRGDGLQAMQLFDQPWEDIRFMALSDEGYEEMVSEVCAGYAVYLKQLQQRSEPRLLLKAFNQIQLLAVVRQGIYGVDGLNQAVEEHLQRQRLISLTGDWYIGRPVMIIRNDYQLGLFNGDIGITVADEDGRLRVWFELSDGEMKGVLPGRLPEHETVYAMTVHKSQGSEFDQVVMILPAEDTPLLTRELIYTGITRAKSKFALQATPQAFIKGSHRRTERASGLSWRLWQATGASATEI